MFLIIFAFWDWHCFWFVRKFCVKLILVFSKIVLIKKVYTACFFFEIVNYFFVVFPLQYYQVLKANFGPSCSIKTTTAIKSIILVGSLLFRHIVTKVQPRVFEHFLRPVVFSTNVFSTTFALISYFCSKFCKNVNILRKPVYFRSIKLFSRHIKIDKQAEALKKTLFHFAVGTPERLKALLEQGMISCLVLFYCTSVLKL